MPWARRIRRLTRSIHQGIRPPNFCSRRYRPDLASDIHVGANRMSEELISRNQPTRRSTEKQSLVTLIGLGAHDLLHRACSFRTRASEIRNRRICAWSRDVSQAYSCRSATSYIQEMGQEIPNRFRDHNRRLLSSLCARCGRQCSWVSATIRQRRGATERRALLPTRPDRLHIRLVLHITFDCDQRYPECTRDLRLSCIAIDDQLGTKKSESRQCPLLMDKHRQVAIKVVHLSISLLKGHLRIDVRDSCRKDR